MAHFFLHGRHELDDDVRQIGLEITVALPDVGHFVAIVKPVKALKIVDGFPTPGLAAGSKRTCDSLSVTADLIFFTSFFGSSSR